MKSRIAVLCMLALFAMSLCLSVVSCGGGGNVGVDALNDSAYKMRYRSLDSTYMYASMAHDMSGSYSDGKYEAMCYMAFVRMMHMDYDSARAIYNTVGKSTSNQLLKLISDVGQMRICQRTSDNREFYDHRFAAMECIDRIENESDNLNERQKRLFDYARSEFHLVSCDFYHSLRQESQAMNEMSYLTDHRELVEDDDAQMAYYCYMMGRGGFKGKGSFEEMRNEEMRMLSRCLMVSHISGNSYFESNAMLSIADILVDADSLIYSRVGFLKDMFSVRGGDVSVLPLMMAEWTLAKARDYGNIYTMSKAYVTMSHYYFYHGRYDEALECLGNALHFVNEHHSRYYGFENPEDSLSVFEVEADSVSTEMKWIADDRIKTVPAWIADIREMLSMTYSAKGMKRESDYNRNIYLDILDATRQDMEMQSRYDNLLQREKNINALLLFVAVVAVAVITLVVVWGRRLRRNGFFIVDKLSKVLEICRRITGSVPADVSNVDDIRTAVMSSVDSDVRSLFPDLGDDLYREKRGMAFYDKEMIRVIQVFYEWTVRNGEMYLGLGGERRKLEEERAMHELRIVGNKRDNIDKCTCLSIVYGITPYLDRIVCEVKKMLADVNSEQNGERLKYVSELVDKINDYNDVLLHWIKMRQGTVSLHVETFSLAPLFETLRKSRNAFSMKGILLDVVASDSCVKADKALTLFMMNTLLENARKFTPEGGKVCLGAVDGEKYVEIYVADTGCGLSEADVDKIVNEKVYDSSTIGNDSASAGNKGSGFGLMNCRGIIEKYKKTSSLFSVCAFGVESRLGQGSRFFFRLPKSVTRTLCLLAFVISAFMPISCGHTIGSTDNTSEADSVVWSPDDPRLKKASFYADQAYFCNVDGYYEYALTYIDSARMMLNDYYLSVCPEGNELMSMSGTLNMPEIDLWNRGFNTDYHVILDIRNEAAIAALALKRWNVYHYNNEVYTRLYKLMAQDKNIEQYCNDLQESYTNKLTIIILIVTMIVLGLAAYYMMYYRHNQLFLLNMSQLLRFNRRMFSFTAGGESLDREDERIGRYVEILHEGINDIHLSDGVALCVPSGEAGTLRFSFSNGCPEREYLEEMMKSTYQNRRQYDSAGTLRTYPLTIENDGENVMVGVLAVVVHNSSLSDDEEIIIKLIAQFTAIHLFYSKIKLDSKLVDIELLEDEKRRAEMEENAIHVQNMVLDNCLSTIKHETMYYPNRIRKIVDDLISADGSPDKSAIVSMDELVCYYKEVFTLLSMCAARQLDNVMFRRRRFEVAVLGEYARRRFDKLNRKAHLDVVFNIASPSKKLKAVGDVILLEYLVDSLLTEAFQCAEPGTLSLDFSERGDFVAFTFTDERRTYDEQTLNSLFYPDSLSIDSQHGTLNGTQFLVCRQIIREHDNCAGRRGCRIYAERAQRGFRIVFTIPLSA